MKRHEWDEVNEPEVKAECTQEAYTHRIRKLIQKTAAYRKNDFNCNLERRRTSVRLSVDGRTKAIMNKLAEQKSNHR